MKINFAKLTLKEYLEVLADRQPVPGGGSAAALTGSLGVGLLLMVAKYSQGRKSNTKLIEKKIAVLIEKLTPMQERLLELTSLDSIAYLNLRAGKDKGEAKAVPQEICQITYRALEQASILVDVGNPYLLSDVEVAIELLFASFKGAQVMVRINS